jgi:excisionase family DNA binding protein
MKRPLNQMSLDDLWSMEVHQDYNVSGKSRLLLGDEIISISEASRLLGVSIYTIRKCIRNRELPAHSIGKRVLISSKELYLWFLNQSYSHYERQKANEQKTGKIKRKNKLFYSR